MRDPERLAWNSALRDRRHADDWWIANHGPLAPSRLDAELDDAFALLAVNAELGFGGWRGHPVRKLRLACGFFIVYQVRPILREVLFLRILAAPRMHG